MLFSLAKIICRNINKKSTETRLEVCTEGTVDEFDFPLHGLTKGNKFDWNKLVSV